MADDSLILVITFRPHPEHNAVRAEMTCPPPTPPLPVGSEQVEELWRILGKLEPGRNSFCQRYKNMQSPLLFSPPSLSLGWFDRWGHGSRIHLQGLLSLAALCPG